MTPNLMKQPTVRPSGYDYLSADNVDHLRSVLQDVGRIMMTTSDIIGLVNSHDESLRPASKFQIIQDQCDELAAAYYRIERLLGQEF